MTSVASWDDPSKMVCVDDVVARILSLVEALPSEEVDLPNAVGRVLATDIIAPSDVPPFRNSAMDGYAIRSSDAVADRGATFDLAGTIAAGTRSPGAIRPGEAARIMTGAPMPDGADAVVRFEEVEQTEDGRVHVARAVSPGENVRLAGEDIRRGKNVLRRGASVGAAEVGILAALNIGRVTVYRRPRIGVLSTGDEIIDLGPDLQPGQIRDANGYALAARVIQMGAVPHRLGIAGDRRLDLTERLAAARDCDLLLTSGGVSAGDFDVVKQVFQQEGEVDILTVRMKPGKPLAIGRIGETPMLGLPGNPVAAMVAFDQFARPAIRRMLGHAAVKLPTIRARLTVGVDNRGRRRHFERGVLSWDGQRWSVRPTGIHGAGMLTSLVAANCYIVIDEDCSGVVAGDDVDVQILDLASALQVNGAGAGETEAS